jgi:periplasmic copper chaperone A
MLNGKLRFNHRLLRRWLGLPALFFVLSPSVFLAPVSAAELQIENPWVQLAPPNAMSHAAYMRFTNTNTNKQPVTITHIRAATYAQAMLHQTTIAGDKVHMGHLATLVIPAKSSVILAPSAIHLMLMQPQQPQKIHDKVSITLSFSDGTEQHFIAPVQANHE